GRPVQVLALNSRPDWIGLDPPRDCDDSRGREGTDRGDGRVQVRVAVTEVRAQGERHGRVRGVARRLTEWHWIVWRRWLHEFLLLLRPPGLATNGNDNARPPGVR